jgi:hypothetical protein
LSRPQNYCEHLMCLFGVYQIKIYSGLCDPVIEQKLNYV